MARQFDDLPPEAAKAIRLADAFCQYADRQLFIEYCYTKKQLRAEGKWQYFGSPKGVEGYVLSEFGDLGRQTTGEARALTLEIEARFVRELRGGQLTAWAREGSPLAPWQEIPASAWWVLWPDKLHKGIVKGPPDVELFNVRVGPRASVALLPAPGDAGRPPKMIPIKEEFKRRRRKGLTEPSKSREAEALAAWFKRTYPDADAVAAKTISNWLGSPDGDVA